MSPVGQDDFIQRAEQGPTDTDGFKAFPVFIAQNQPHRRAERHDDIKCADSGFKDGHGHLMEFDILTQLHFSQRGVYNGDKEHHEASEEAHKEDGDENSHIQQTVGHCWLFYFLNFKVQILDGQEN